MINCQCLKIMDHTLRNYILKDVCVCVLVWKTEISILTWGYILRCVFEHSKSSLHEKHVTTCKESLSFIGVPLLLYGNKKKERYYASPTISELSILLHLCLTSNVGPQYHISCQVIYCIKLETLKVIKVNSGGVQWIF